MVTRYENGDLLVKLRGLVEICCPPIPPPLPKGYHRGAAYDLPPRVITDPDPWFQLPTDKYKVLTKKFKYFPTPSLSKFWSPTTETTHDEHFLQSPSVDKDDAVAEESNLLVSVLKSSSELSGTNDVAATNTTELQTETLWESFRTTTELVPESTEKDVLPMHDLSGHVNHLKNEIESVLDASSHLQNLNEENELNPPEEIAFTPVLQICVVLAVLAVLLVLLFHHHHIRRECAIERRIRRKQKEIKEDSENGDVHDVTL